MSANDMLVAATPPQKQVEVHRLLTTVLGPTLDQLSASTGVTLVLAAAAYTPAPYPRMRTKGGLQAIANDAASDAVLTSQGYT
jgi:hypothetical protein